ncbi:PfkB family carbohydrate kinase [Desulfitobacterium hafniense]|uniref:Carbohydrate kinase PfkB domain-containing protein n=1 Tax=Desulfitobacterium hafniense TaxID=49338 RepID=A0A0W1JJH0_DESHA|nr:PfkB family carbohydrate kinase [Desulfitobacterium hafniense]KTE91833.1 hypothetical protein AT727_20365 [Desulfitobacterium hafniense]
MKLAIFGEIGVDWLVDRNGFIQSRWGGAGLYAAVAAARQEAGVELLTLIGPELNRNIKSIWEFLGVSFNKAQYHEKYSFPRYMVTGFSNYQTKVTRPMSQLKFNHQYYPQISADVQGILIFPIGHTIPIELCREAFERGIPVFLDPKPNQESILDAREALPYTTFLLVNEQEILLLAETDNRSNAIDKLKDAGPEYIVVKNGIRGCSIFKKGILVEEIPAFRSLVLCSLGSGDVFGGVLATTFLETQDLKFSADLASCVAANFIENFEVETVIPKKAARIDVMQRERISWLSSNLQVYLAGPFFSDQELFWVNQVCDILESAGIRVLSPSRENGVIGQYENWEQRKTIFEQDLVLLENADLVVAILDHDDPGTCFEMGYAYNKKIPIIGLKTSISPLNNMITFGCNKICTSIEQLMSEVYSYGKK